MANFWKFTDTENRTVYINKCSQVLCVREWEHYAPEGMIKATTIAVALDGIENNYVVLNPIEEVLKTVSSDSDYTVQIEETGVIIDFADPDECVGVNLPIEEVKRIVDLKGW